MSIVYEIGITEKNNKAIEKKQSIEVIASKGIVGDRYFHDFNGDREQITLIESENIDYYNESISKIFPYQNSQMPHLCNIILLPKYNLF